LSVELDDIRVKKWDQAAEDMIATKVIVSGIDKKVTALNGTVYSLRKEHLIQQGMLMTMRFIMGTTLGLIGAGGTIAGIVLAVIKLSG